MIAYSIIPNFNKLLMHWSEFQKRDCSVSGKLLWGSSHVSLSILPTIGKSSIWMVKYANWYMIIKIGLITILFFPSVRIWIRVIWGWAPIFSTKAAYREETRNYITVRDTWRSHAPSSECHLQTAKTYICSVNCELILDVFWSLLKLANTNCIVISLWGVNLISATPALIL